MFLNSIPQTPKLILCTLQKAFSKEKGGRGKKKKNLTTRPRKYSTNTLAGWYHTREEKYPRNNFVTTIHWENIYNWVFGKLKKYMPYTLKVLRLSSKFYSPLEIVHAKTLPLLSHVTCEVVSIRNISDSGERHLCPNQKTKNNKKKKKRRRNSSSKEDVFSIRLFVAHWLVWRASSSDVCTPALKAKKKEG